jgi:hypothetical protein
MSVLTQHPGTAVHAVGETMASQLSIPLYLQVPTVAEYVHPATRPHAASEPALEHRQRFTACWQDSSAVPRPPCPPAAVVRAVPPACPPEPEAAVLLLLVQAASGVEDSRQATAKQCIMSMITPSAILPGVLASRAMICVPVSRSFSVGHRTRVPFVATYPPSSMHLHAEAGAFAAGVTGRFCQSCCRSIP